MPTLPTLTVTQAQADRILAAFGDANAYKAWLKDRIVDFVATKEAQTRLDQFLADEATKRSTAVTELSQ